MDCRSNLTKSYVAAVDISAVPLATDLAFVENVMRLEAGGPRSEPPPKHDSKGSGCVVLPRGNEHLAERAVLVERGVLVDAAQVQRRAHDDDA